MQDFTKVVAIACGTLLVIFSGFLYFINRFIKQIDEHYDEFKRCREENCERLTRAEKDIEWIKAGNYERRKT